MAETPNTSVAVNEEKNTVDNESYLQQKIRYVGPKETVAYVINDMAGSFNIALEYGTRFVNSILKLEYNYQTIVNLINGVWDIVNDFFSAAIVDKTRTRIGKFKPYLLFLSVPGTILTVLYWLQPMFFPDNTDNPVRTAFYKFIFYLVLQLIQEGVGTFRSFAGHGLLATITPHPVDRTRLITVARFFSGFLGEKLPEQLMTIFLDLIGNGKLKWKYDKLFMGMGIFTTVVAGAANFWFFFVCKERVMQSVETPSIKQGFKAILNNKPILLLTLSGVLGDIGLKGGSKSDYLIDVLNFASMQFVTGIPGAIVHPVSYTLVPRFKKMFSTRSLYILGKYSGNLLYIPVFLFGLLGPKNNRMYKRLLPMGLALTVWETVFMFFYSLKSVIPSEMYNEAIDYCEWKNGYRAEAMISAAQGLVGKFSGLITRTINTQFKKWIGYDQEAYTRGTAQSEKTKFWLFASFTLMPAISSILGSLPMLFYDLSGEKRDRMYDELLARRNAFSAKGTSGSAEDLQEIAKEQKRISEEKRKL